MNSANIAMLEVAAAALGDLLNEVVFVGGATVSLWITDEAAPELRPTDDVDVIVEITTRRDYYRFESRLREAGFRNHPEDGVICRFKQPESDLLLDVMPTEASILGFENRWQKGPSRTRSPLPCPRECGSRQSHLPSSLPRSSRLSFPVGRATSTGAPTSRISSP